MCLADGDRVGVTRGPLEEKSLVREVKETDPKTSVDPQTKLEVPDRHGVLRDPGLSGEPDAPGVQRNETKLGC